MNRILLVALLPFLALLSLPAPAQKVDADALWKKATSEVPDQLPLLIKTVRDAQTFRWDSLSSSNCQQSLWKFGPQLTRFKEMQEHTPTPLHPEYDRQLASLQLMTDLWRLRTEPTDAAAEQAVLDRLDPNVEWQKKASERIAYFASSRAGDTRQKARRNGHVSSPLQALKEQKYADALALSSGEDPQVAKAILLTVMDKGDKTQRQGAAEAFLRRYQGKSPLANTFAAQRKKKESMAWRENVLMIFGPACMLATLLFFLTGRTEPTAARELQRVNRLGFEGAKDSAWVAAYQRLQNLPPDNAHRVTAETFICETLAERWDGVAGKEEAAASAAERLNALYEQFYES